MVHRAEAHKHRPFLECTPEPFLICRFVDSAGLSAVISETSGRRQSTCGANTRGSDPTVLNYRNVIREVAFGGGAATNGEMGSVRRRS